MRRSPPPPTALACDSSWITATCPSFPSETSKEADWPTAISASCQPLLHVPKELRALGHPPNRNSLDVETRIQKLFSYSLSPLNMLVPQDSLGWTPQQKISLRTRSTVTCPIGSHKVFRNKMLLSIHKHGSEGWESWALRPTAYPPLQPSAYVYS